MKSFVFYVAMFKIGEAQIDNDVAVERFACDLTVCKGACCTMPGGRGAPLRDDEVAELKNALPVVWNDLSDKHRSLIEREGVAEGIAGSYATVCLDKCACVFVYYQDGIAGCSIEKAWFEGKLKWRKPISCHLFPLRIRKIGEEYIRYEWIEECSSGRKAGNKNGIHLHDFMKDALVRKYGDKWYDEFLAECRRRIDVLK